MALPLFSLGQDTHQQQQVLIPNSFPTIAHAGWTVELSGHWDVLGPFPIHAREQHFLSPSFPLNLSEPLDLSKEWPSSYADGGSVGWGTILSEDGDLKVSFPKIRWDVLRATEGWAALQHHAVLRATLTVTPPASEDAPAQFPRLLVNLIQGSFFTLRPSTGYEDYVPAWYSGNIYDIERAPPQTVPLPGLSWKEPTTFDFFISGDYEIRLFGVPEGYGSPFPIQSLSVSVELELPAHGVSLDPTQDVVCDFVDGFAFGDVIGVGLRSVDGWWTVDDVHTSEAVQGFHVQLVRPTRIAPTQTRIVPLKITQSSRFAESEIALTLTLSSAERTRTLSIRLPIKHHVWPPAAAGVYIQATYLYSESSPTAFYTIPPLERNNRDPAAPIIALHGAGVDIFSTTMWQDSLPRQNNSWLVIPSGRTAWGLDWHGPSSDDVWQSLDGLTAILEKMDIFQSWVIAPDARAVIIGHSNGGQATWWNAVRYPDRALAIIPAAGYIKSQAYVPLTLSRAAHYIDPSLRTILETSLTPDDNDLFLSNLAKIPVLAIHGGDDDNVPTWHGREYVSILRALLHPNVTFREDPGQPHWYPSVLDSEEVQQFLNTFTAPGSAPADCPSEFTLTVAIPAEFGSLCGLKIDALRIPGRLARAHVAISDELILVKTSNVKSMSWDRRILGKPLVIDGANLSVNAVQDHGRVSLRSPRQGAWHVSEQHDIIMPQNTGRMQRILRSQGPLVIVIPDDPSTRAGECAFRVAHDLNLYHRIDVEIITHGEALERSYSGGLGKSNIVVISGLQDAFTAKILHERLTPFHIQDDALHFDGAALDSKTIMAAFLHPHPVNQDASIMFMISNDDAGLERLTRLFPIRTGVTVPDWIILDGAVDVVGAGGVTGAGLWDDNWKSSEATSYFTA